MQGMDAGAGLGRFEVLANNPEGLDDAIKTELYAMKSIPADAQLGMGSTVIHSHTVQGYNLSPMIINDASTKICTIRFGDSS